METKTCLHCNTEKEIDQFATYKKRSGQLAYRNVCKLCRNEQDRKSRGIDTTKEYTPRITTTTKSNSGGFYNMLTVEEVETLKKIIDNADTILNIISNKIESSNSDYKKIKKSITISENIHNQILTLSTTNKLNYSQVVESLLKKALE